MSQKTPIYLSILFSVLMVSQAAKISISRQQVKEQIKNGYKSVKKSIKSPFKKIGSRTKTTSTTTITLDLSPEDLESETLNKLIDGFENISKILEGKKSKKKNEFPYALQISNFGKEIMPSEARELYSLFLDLERKLGLNEGGKKMSSCLNSAVDLVKAGFDYTMGQRAKDNDGSSFNQRSQQFLFQKAADSFLKEKCQNLKFLGQETDDLKGALQYENTMNF